MSLVGERKRNAAPRRNVGRAVCPSPGKLAIRVENLSKRFQIGGGHRGYKTLRESLTNALMDRLRPARAAFNGSANRRRSSDTIWAIKDLSFEIQRGDVVAVIGRNGAGKSTLLKILSRITEPTSGYADIFGRVGSLLEVGAGFHPELTGRENIFLNGAILGMTRAEIQRKFDRIVDFSSVEKFIDTPIKRYSSGMHLRLAFAVAAHLEPDILLVDEVLAVGDVEFQKKCIGRMDEVAHEGRTVLFVSHNMGAVRSLCQKGIYLDAGRIVASGDVSSCIARYFESVGALSGTAQYSGKDADQGTAFGRVSVNGGTTNKIDQCRPFRSSTVLHLDDEASGFYLYCVLEDMHGRSLFSVGTTSQELEIAEISCRDYRIDVEFPPLWLVPGLYSMHFKAVIWSQAGSKYVSDKFPVDVQGQSSSSRGDRILHPPAVWMVT